MPEDCEYDDEQAGEGGADISHFTHRLTDSLPGVLQSEHRGVGEGGTDLEDAVKVVETPADISHGCPLLCRKYGGQIR